MLEAQEEKVSAVFLQFPSCGVLISKEEIGFIGQDSFRSFPVDRSKEGKTRRKCRSNLCAHNKFSFNNVCNKADKQFESTNAEVITSEMATICSI